MIIFDRERTRERSFINDSLEEALSLYCCLNLGLFASRVNCSVIRLDRGSVSQTRLLSVALQEAPRIHTIVIEFTSASTLRSLLS